MNIKSDRLLSLTLNSLSFAVLLASSLAFQACGKGTPDVAVTKFDSAHSVALDGTITQGKIIASGSSDAVIASEVGQQLLYTMGQFNGRSGVADLSRLQVSPQAKIARPDGRFDVTYSAKVLVSWPREYAVPASIGLIMPAAGTWSGLSDFYDAYGADEESSKLCLAGEAHEVSSGIFWYYYRPEKAGCPLANAAADDASLVARFPIDLAFSAENTENKSPEYEKVWEDGKLVVTSIFGKFEFGATATSDAGIAAYRAFYGDLIRAYGQPTSTNLAAGSYPSATNDVVELQFMTSAGLLDINLLLVDEIKSVDAAFKARYNARTAISDFVSYSGHSGLGANIRALARMGQFSPGHYQVYLVNGCDTFAYVDNALKDAHLAANPGSGPDKYFDIITNAMPSYFSMNSLSNMAVIKGLLGKRQTYRQILSSFDQSQRAAVTGEQDNQWPLPFNG